MAVLALAISPMGARASGAVIKLAGPDFPPYYEMIDGRMDGHLARILTSIVESAGFGWRGEIFPAARLMSGLVTGVAQSSLLVRNKTLDEAPTVLRSPKAITEMVLNVYSLKTAVEIAEREDFRGKTVVVMRGYGYGGLRTWLDQPENRVTLLEANNFESAIFMLSGGRAPLALMYDVNFEAGIKAAGRRPDNIVENAFQRVPLYIYLNRSVSDDPQRTMDALMTSYDALVRDHVLMPPRNRPEAVIGGEKS